MKKYKKLKNVKHLRVKFFVFLLYVVCTMKNLKEKIKNIIYYKTKSKIKSEKYI